MMVMMMMMMTMMDYGDDENLVMTMKDECWMLVAR